MPDKVDEGKLEEEIKPDASGKFPESVPWNKYVGIKESLGKKLDNATQKIVSLEERLKNAPNTDEFSKTKKELDELRLTHQKVSDELKSFKDKSISEKREVLKAKGIPEEDLKDLSEVELTRLAKVVGNIKVTPKPDMGVGGGGGGNLTGSPMELAQRAYSTSNKK